MPDASRLRRPRTPFAAFRDLRTTAKAAVAFVPVCVLVLGRGLVALRQDDACPTTALLTRETARVPEDVAEALQADTAAELTTTGASTASQAADDPSRMSAEPVRRFRY
jgi:hypothetical protein